MLFDRRRCGPSAAVVSIAHLTDEERQFVVTLLLSKLVTWMRVPVGHARTCGLIDLHGRGLRIRSTQRGSRPAKRPILTILKQARAFGVGMVLSTQNPVDLDYKAISNAGTWMIGRLQTERDKRPPARRYAFGRGRPSIIDASWPTPSATSANAEFVLPFDPRRRNRAEFGTRWAMSYLPGPLTREQISEL